MFTLTPRIGDAAAAAAVAAVPSLAASVAASVVSSALAVDKGAEVPVEGTCSSTADFMRPAAHTQVDYLHCLVPDLLDITRCSFYWGKMDRYEAERLLENRPDGTFLLRDSAQEEYLFR